MRRLSLLHDDRTVGVSFLPETHLQKSSGPSGPRAEERVMLNKLVPLSVLLLFLRLRSKTETMYSTPVFVGSQWI